MQGNVQRHAHQRFAAGLVNVTAHGRCVATPQQQPAEKQPSRPMPWPSAMAGANTSAVFSGRQLRLAACTTHATASARDQAAVEHAARLQAWPSEKISPGCST